MTKRSFSSLLLLSVAAAACADSNRSVTAPDVHPSYNEASSSIGFASTAEGPFDVLFSDANAPMTLMAASAQAATGSRASGHVGFTFAPPVFGLTSEQYSFNASSTDPSTFAAKGQWEMMLTAAAGFEQRFHGEVICMATVGNTTRLAGLISKVWINNVQRPITGATHVIWTVVDNGEGQGSTDTASPMFFNNAANAATHCNTGFSPAQFTPQTGNVQVQ